MSQAALEEPPVKSRPEFPQRIPRPSSKLQQVSRVSDRDYDIFLASAFEPEADPGCEKNFSLYDAIGKRLESRLEKRVFIPYKEIDLSLNPRETYKIIESSINRSRLVVADLEVESIAVGSMLSLAARNHRKPIIYFHPESIRPDPNAEGGIQFEAPRYWKVAYKNQAQALDMIEKAAREFFRQ